ncbi:MAG: hypothetical protein HJJLKODD_01107 [Phycisphaerae bacterium]|nr:hypothetical protein [Phycisphaerae bacterium]
MSPEETPPATEENPPSTTTDPEVSGWLVMAAILFTIYGLRALFRVGSKISQGQLGELDGASWLNLLSVVLAVGLWMRSNVIRWLAAFYALYVFGMTMLTMFRTGSTNPLIFRAVICIGLVAILLRYSFPSKRPQPISAI